MKRFTTAILALLLMTACNNMLHDPGHSFPEQPVLHIGIPEETLEKIRTIAVKAYCALDASGLSRVDFFIDKDSNQIYFNEINTLPGFTPISMFPKMCLEAGLDFEELTTLLINEAILRYDSRAKLQTSR